MFSSVGGIMFQAARGSALISLVALIAGLTAVGIAPASQAADAGCVDNVPRSAYPADGAAPGNAPIGQGNYFSYPNRTYGERVAIMNRVINTINSTWGTYYTAVARKQPATCITDPDGTYVDYQRHQGTIKMATWSFNHWGVRDALVKAEQRGVSVQIIAASGVNRVGVNGAGPHKPWFSVRDYLRTQWSSTRSYAWECGGACRGAGGAPHSKYFLFNDVGSGHISNIMCRPR